ncbi:MAG: ABC transporter ATP-binding protein [Planctomycetes bacterium]|nr:ABC transporter ATP-binding protein [Planctomycetota bacterium]MBW8035566.1 ABC transporter ATP-binding protein [Planctomycetota bacterium]
MISAINITKTYTGQDGTITALGGVSFKVRRGDFVAVIGRSGTGKSTLLGVTGGLLKPSSGEVFLDGQSVWNLDEQSRARFRGQKIGFVFQNASVISSLTVLENVVLPQSFLPKSTTANMSRAMNLIESVGLGHRTHAYPDQLSGGEKRRVAIASALMNDPPLLLADEPTGDLDSETESEIMSLFANLWQSGTTIIMVTHNQQLANYANRIFKMDDGLIIESSGQTEAEDSFS